MPVPGPVPGTRTCCTQFCRSVLLGEYGAIQRPMTATTTKGATITSPAITLGERGRPSVRAGERSVPTNGGTGARDVLLVVIASRHLPRARIDQHIDDVGEQIGDEHHQGDDDKDPLHEAVVELAKGVVE